MKSENEVSFTKILFPQTLVDKLFEHCNRKNNLDFYCDESKEQKAYGFIGGKILKDVIEIKDVSILKKNARFTSPYKELVDEWMSSFAVSSITPLEKRGWVASPSEANKILMSYLKNEWEWIGSYHMHRVAWKNDPLRDGPTLLDTVMAKNTKQIMFIVSMVNPSSPILRAYYEGEISKEIPIEIVGSYEK